MRVECDKRSSVVFEKDGKHYTMMGDITIYERDGISAPLMIRDPNIVALLLDISEKAFSELTELFKRVEEHIKLADGGNVYVVNLMNSEGKFFDIIEKLFISVAFAHSAMEAFVNNLIPKAYTHEIKQKKNGAEATLTVDKKWIERNLTINNKIKEIIPSIYQIDLKLENCVFWENFIELLEMRNAIIHPRTDLKNPKAPTQISFISKILYKGLGENVTSSSRDLISHISRLIQDGKHEIPISPHIPFEFRDKLTTLEDYGKF